MENENNDSPNTEETVDLEQLDSEVVSENSDEQEEALSSRAALRAKRRRKKIVITIVGILALVGIGGSIGYSKYVKSTTTIVPEAVSYIAESDEVEPCKTFEDAALFCEVKWVTNDNVRRGALINQSINSGDRVKKDSEIVLNYSSGPSETEFPNLNGVSLDEAKSKLYAIGVTIKEIKLVDSNGRNENTVISSSINAGDKVKNGDEVTLEVSNGKIDVPDWTGKTREFVEADAKKIGISVTFKEEENDGASGLVLSQTPKAGEVGTSTNVEVVISKSFESKEITVPDVIGKTAEEAQIELATAGFRHIKTVTVKNSEVTETQVTQVVPGVGQTGKSEENIVIIVSEPSE